MSSAMARHKTMKFLLLFVALISGNVFAAPPLRVAVNLGATMPVGRVEAGVLQSGITLDIYQEVARILGRELSQVAVPRKRLDRVSHAGGLDLRCHVTPAWVDKPEEFEWSRVLYRVDEVLFGVSGQPVPASVDALPHGTLVSVVLGYHYAILDPLFASGHLLRDDSPDESKVLKKVGIGRTSFGVISTLGLYWYRKTYEQHGLAGWQLTVGNSTPIHCAVPKQGLVAAKPLLDALDQLIRSGKIDQILSRYR